MKKIIKKGAIFLMLAMGLTLASCGKKEKAVEIDKNTIFRETEITVPTKENFQVSSMAYQNGRVYYVGITYNEEDFSSNNYFCSINVDGSDLKEIEFNPGEEGSNYWIENLLVADNGNAYLFYSAYKEDYSDPDNPIYENSYNVYVIDEAGNGKAISLKDLVKDSNVNLIRYAGDNKFLMQIDSTMYLLDENMSVIKKSDMGDNYYGNTLTLKDGTFSVCYWGDNGQVISKFDLDNLAIGDAIEVPFDISSKNVLQGYGYDLFFNDNTCLYGWNVGDKEMTPLLNYVNSDVMNSYYDLFAGIDEKTYVGVYTDWDAGNYGELKIATFTKVPPEEVKDKKSLTMGCMYLDSDLKKKVIDFNKASDEYRILIQDYSSYNTEDDWEAGYKRFNSDIAAGNAPDIIVSSDMGVKNYMSKGLFLDLTDYLKNDPEIDYNDIFPNLIEAMSYDGKLYMVSRGFYISTVAGKKSVIGDRTSWTMKEMMDFEKTLPEGSELFSLNSRSSFLYSILSANATDYVDWNEGKCYFNTEEFMDLLEYVKTIPTDEELESVWSDEDFWANYDSMWRENKVILQNANIYSPYAYRQLVRVTFGEPVSFIGYPSTSGQGSSIYLENAALISAKSKYPDVAWEIVRTFMAPEEVNPEFGYRYYGSIPAFMSEFDKQCEEAMKEESHEDGDGEVIIYKDTTWVGGEEIEIDPLTQAEVDELKNFVKSVNSINQLDNDILVIIQEETEPFYQGQKTAKEVADIIQSRVSIYINEKR